MPAHEAPHHAGAAEEDMLAAAIGSEVRGLLLSPCSFKLLDFNTDFDSHMSTNRRIKWFSSCLKMMIPFSRCL